jgi:hypothetical protein
MRPDGQRRTTGQPSNQALYLFFTSPLCHSPRDYKRERRATVQGLDLLQIEHHFKGLGSDTLSQTACNPYYKHS